MLRWPYTRAVTEGSPQTAAGSTEADTVEEVVFAEATIDGEPTLRLLEEHLSSMEEQAMIGRRASDEEEGSAEEGLDRRFVEWYGREDGEGVFYEPRSIIPLASSTERVLGGYFVS